MKIEYVFDSFDPKTGIQGKFLMQIKVKDAVVTAHIGLTSTHFDIDFTPSTGPQLHLKGLTGEELVAMAYPEIEKRASDAASGAAPAGDPSSSSSG